jgi:hypothetical protein
MNAYCLGFLCPWDWFNGSVPLFSTPLEAWYLLDVCRSFRDRLPWLSRLPHLGSLCSQFTIYPYFSPLHRPRYQSHPSCMNPIPQNHCPRVEVCSNTLKFTMDNKRLPLTLPSSLPLPISMAQGPSCAYPISLPTSVPAPSLTSHLAPHSSPSSTSQNPLNSGPLSAYWRHNNVFTKINSLIV